MPADAIERGLADSLWGEAEGRELRFCATVFRQRLQFACGGAILSENNSLFEVLPMRFTCSLAIAIFAFLQHQTFADSFGSGANAFDIEFVAIGAPENEADTANAPLSLGSVPYFYRMGKHEISEQMVVTANTLGGLQLTPSQRGPQKPVTAISWNNMARFVNWLNTSTGNHAAYKFDAQPGEVGYDPNALISLWQPSDAGYDQKNLYRNRLAKYFLPSEDEWYKAAFYNPGSGSYFSFPTADGSEPVSVSSGTDLGTAVFNLSIDAGPADITLAGGKSAFGTVGQGGNVWERLESDLDGVNDASNALKVERGGAWYYLRDSLSSGSASRISDIPTISASVEGFRVASVPEPSGAILMSIITATMLLRRH